MVEYSPYFRIWFTNHVWTILLLLSIHAFKIILYYNMVKNPRYYVFQYLTYLDWTSSRLQALCNCYHLQILKKIKLTLLSDTSCGKRRQQNYSCTVHTLENLSANLVFISHHTFTAFYAHAVGTSIRRQKSNHFWLPLSIREIIHSLLLEVLKAPVDDAVLGLAIFAIKTGISRANIFSDTATPLPKKKWINGSSELKRSLLSTSTASQRLYLPGSSIPATGLNFLPLGRPLTFLVVKLDGPASPSTGSSSFSWMKTSSSGTAISFPFPWAWVGESCFVRSLFLFIWSNVI